MLLFYLAAITTYSFRLHYYWIADDLWPFNGDVDTTIGLIIPYWESAVLVLFNLSRFVALKSVSQVHFGPVS